MSERRRHDRSRAIIGQSRLVHWLLLGVSATVLGAGCGLEHGGQRVVESCPVDQGQSVLQGAGIDIVSVPFETRTGGFFLFDDRPPSYAYIQSEDDGDRMGVLLTDILGVPSAVRGRLGQEQNSWGLYWGLFELESRPGPDSPARSILVSLHRLRRTGLAGTITVTVGTDLETCGAIYKSCKIRL